MEPVGSPIRSPVRASSKKVAGQRTFERVVSGGLLLYLLLTLAASAYLAYAPADATLRRLAAPPPCAMRVRTGIACPMCFGTTTYILIWRGWLSAALRLNPFAFGMFWTSVAAIPALLFLMLSGRPVRGWLGWIRPHIWVAVAVAAAILLLLNWAYLIKTTAGVSPESVLARFP